MEKAYNIIYQITNIINGKYYIGIHSTDRLEDGYMGSGKKLKEDIKNYGIENFDREILHHFETREDAFKKEAELVDREFIKNENVYNLVQGGIGCIYRGIKRGVIYSRSKKIRPIKYKEELFEKFDKSCFYNITYHYNGNREEIFEKTNMPAFNRLIDFLTEEWYNRGDKFCFYMTQLINNKYTHKEGVKFVNQFLRFPVMRSEINLTKCEWGQLKLFN